MLKSGRVKKNLQKCQICQHCQLCVITEEVEYNRNQTKEIQF